MQYYTLTHVRGANTRTACKNVVVLSSPKHTPITCQDIDVVLRKVGAHDYWEHPWASVTVDASVLSSNTQGYRVASSEPRHTAVVAPSVDVFTGVDMTTPLTGFRLGFHVKGAESISWPFEELRSECHLVWALTSSVCKTCKMNNQLACRWALFTKKLRGMGVTKAHEQFYACSSLHFQQKNLRDPAPIVPVEGLPLNAKTCIGRRAWNLAYDETMVKRAGDVGTYEYISAYYTSTWSATNTRWKTDTGACSVIKHDPDTIQRRVRAKSNQASNAATARERRSDICGTKEEACYLEDRCSLWRRQNSCVRMQSESDFSAYAEQHFDENPEELAPPQMLYLSSLVAGREFDLIDERTEHVRGSTMGGAAKRSRYASSLFWSILTDSGRRTLRFHSWLELTQHIRRYAPWELSFFEDAKKKADALVCDVNPESLRLSTLRLSGRVRVRSGFGYSSYSPIGICVYPLPAYPEDPNYVWSFKPSMRFEDGSSRSPHTVRSYMYGYKFLGLTPPHLFTPKPGSPLKVYTYDVGGE